MPEIKTRKVVKGAVKALDKSAALSNRMKSAMIRTKKATEQTTNAEETSAEEYASNHVSGWVDRAAHRAVHEFNQQGRKSIQATKKNLLHVKERLVRRRAQKQPQPNMAKEIFHSRGAFQKSAQSAAKPLSKGAVKATRKTFKTTERTAKTTAQATRQTAKAARTTTRAAHTVSKAAVNTLKTVVRASIAAAKAAIAATKALVSALIAGGWIAVVVVIVLCLIGFLIGSCYGIFFSGEDSGSGITIQNVIEEINADYQAQIDSIKSNTSYDIVEIIGSRAVWPEVLAVYAVKTTTDPDNAQEVATIDEAKKTMLKEIFWQMNILSSRTETRTEEVVTETDDGNGNLVESTSTVTRTYLYITVSHKTAEEMASLYGFNVDQQAQLLELLAEENDALWSQLLNGITGNADIVSVALSQVGNVGGET